MPTTTTMTTDHTLFLRCPCLRMSEGARTHLAPCIYLFIYSLIHCCISPGVGKTELAKVRPCDKIIIIIKNNEHIKSDSKLEE